MPAVNVTISADARQRLGVVLAAQGAIDEGVRELERAVRIDPAHVDARLDLGVLRLSRRETSEAHSLLASVLDDVPESERARYYNAVALAELGRTDEAEPTLQAMVSSASYGRMATEMLERIGAGEPRTDAP
jgi:cytochrome c-type biogenesis protein CcmH/NrfG